MDILVSVVGKVAEYTVAPIGRQISYFLFYKGNLKELEDHVKELERVRERMSHIVEVERRNGKVTLSDVANWLDEVNSVIEMANKFQKDPKHAKVGCSGLLFANCFSRHQLSRKATKIAKVVVQAQEKGKFGGGVAYLPALDGAPFSSTKSGEKLETREAFKEGILKALKDPSSRNIGVYGLGGLGKTTLMKEVAQIAKQDRLFDVVVVANVSKTPDIKTIQGEIADRLGLQFPEETIVGRRDRLLLRIKGEKTILVILDDMWTTLDLEEVGIPSRYEHNGCKLLMTSRNQEVLLKMDAQKNFTFRLELLNQPETWSLFQFMTGDVVKDITLQNIAIEVAERCAGLPIRIVTVARALKNKWDVKAWKDALRQLQSIDPSEMDAVTYNALELSYNSLESHEMKALFLLCAMLQGNDVEYLLKVAIGLDIFNHINNVDDARNRLYNVIESLKASCLLLEGKTNEQIHMHDFVRDVAISIAHRDHHVFFKGGELKDWPTNNFLTSCTQIILNGCHIHELPQRLDCPNLKSFILISATRSLEIPDTIFEGMGNLSVLDLSNLNLSSLPTSFSSLTYLQTLCLDNCILKNMDAIGGLVNLEFLSLLKSSMIQLPNAIGRLTKLRMLDLSHSGIEIIPPNIISSLNKLEELNMANASIKWEVGNLVDQNVNASLAELQNLPNLTALELQIHEAWILPRYLQLMFEKLKRYKIAIGDVWEWSQIDNGTLKTLMLKLHTSLHLEHGIKALIKGVENLYLDEVVGIENVLYQLNGEGFPLLKNLHIQNNANMKHIVDTTKRNQVPTSFINLETLVLQNLRNLEQICHGPLAINSFCKLGVIQVKDCVQLKYLLSFSMLKELSQLFEIEVSQCHSMKRIMLRDSNSSAAKDITNELNEFLSLRSLTLDHLSTLDNFISDELMPSITESKNQGSKSCVSTPFFSAEVVFPKLDALKLRSLNMNKIWSENQHSMNNLTSLIVENCGGLKYLLSSTMVESFKSLKRLEISKCHLMEEIIATEKRNNGTFALKEVQFSKLETIILKDMKVLKTIWHCHFDTVKTLQVANCEKIVVMFPTQKTYHNLETLEVMDCASVEEIFELTSSENSSIEDTMHLKEITLERLPKLKKIWSMDPQGILCFPNLENVQLDKCEILEYLFPYSVATCCSHLKKISIKGCQNMKVIVAEKRESTCTTPIFQFDQLNTLLLWNLYKLKGFYAGNHTLECPSLIKLDVADCAKLSLFRTSSTSNLDRFGEHKLRLSIQQPAFIIEEVIPNLEHLRISNRDAEMILQAQNLESLFTKLKHVALSNYMNEEATFPYWFLQKIRTLESLTVEWSSFEKIFQDERLVSQKIHTRLKKLSLFELPKLEHICEEGYQIDSVIELLEYLWVQHCPSLKNLLPSSATFNHLIYLKITNCNGLIYLISSSTARSLANLTTMTVKGCNSLEEIIKLDENIDITITSLVILKLKCLPKLNKFYSSKLMFPLLEVVVVRECPRMEIFSKGNTSAPNLRKVKIEENYEEWRWNGNLDDTVKNMFDDKVAFCNIKSLTLSDYPELKDLWYGVQPHDNVFRNLKSLVVERCDFLSDVLFPSNMLQVVHGLEELEVRDCDSLEALFDVKGMKKSKEIEVKQSAHLKRLTLCNLPKLKHIWNEDPYEIINFGNFCKVDVSMCQSLLYIFPLSICQDLGQLEMLMIESCGVEKIVGMEEEGSIMKCSFNFPELTVFRLIRLMSLKNFYPGKHTLECPSLKVLDVYRCEALKMFSFNEVDEIHDTPFQQALFSIEKLSPNLDGIPLNGPDVLRILNGCWKNIPPKIQELDLQAFHETPATNFLKHFHAIFPNLITFQVSNSYFETLFPTKGHLSMQIRSLYLFELENLNYIWEEDFPLDHPFLQQLEVLSVSDCPSLMSLMPSSTSFTNLTKFNVRNCKKLVYLITSSTAKTLVQLTSLIISNCEMILDVVKIDDEQEAEEEDIIFQKLGYLELTCLTSLTSFCYGKHTFLFPSLMHFHVEGCPQMEIFSSGVTIAPYLTSIEVENKRKRWKGDLNTTIQQLFTEKVMFPKSGTLRLSPLNIKFFWNESQYSMNNLTNLIVENCGELRYLLSSTMVERIVVNKVFCNLKSLVVQRCDFLSDVLFPSNMLQVVHGLEEIEVRDCDSLEALFDVKGMKKSKEIEVKQSAHLKRLTLCNLPKLKHIWNEDPYEIINFGNFCKVDVSMCQSLLYIFPLSICQDLGQLEMLMIESCGVEKIVGMEEEGSIMKCSFNFPQLKEFRLIELMNLKNFYPGKHTLECPSLKVLNVYRCEALKMFSFNINLDFQQPDEVDKIQQALFSIDKLSPNLEELSMNGTDAMRILNGCCQEMILHKVEFLRLQCFLETPAANFLKHFHAIFPNLIMFQVRNSSFETLFPTKGHLSMQIISKQIRNLWLFELENLNYIWEEDFPLDHPFLQQIEDLLVWNCPSLMSLVPSSTSFTNLIELDVSDCKKLVYLITSSTAKSLVQLTSLKVKDCEMILDIVKPDDEQKAEEEDIIFKNLVYLEFTSVSSLRSFCYHGKHTFMFPSLTHFHVEGCPKMEIFSSGLTKAPFLTTVEVENKRKRWKGDLNTTIEQLFIEKEVSHPDDK